MPASFPTSVKTFGALADGPAVHHYGDETAIGLEVQALESWVISSETLLATVPAVNLNTATPTTLYTVPVGKSCVVTRFVLRLASTSLSTVSLSIGWTGAAYNDLLADATHTELTGNTLYTILVPKVGSLVGVAAAVMKLLCNILQGVAATCTVDVYGYLF
jgi:hypothetical protein